MTRRNEVLSWLDQRKLELDPWSSSNTAAGHKDFLGGQRLWLEQRKLSLDPLSSRNTEAGNKDL